MDVLHMSFLYITSIIFNLAPARNEHLSPSFTSLNSVSQPLPHFFNNLFITPETFPIDGIFEGSREVEDSKIWVVWWVGKNSTSFVIASCFLKCVWLCIVLKEGFSNIFMGLNSTETFLQGSKSVNVQIRVIGFTTWHNIYQNHPFCIPKTVAMTFPAKGVALNFFRVEGG